MKPKNKIYPLLRMLAVALTAALLGPGCQKDFKWNEPLAVTQNGLNLTSAAGSTRVTVYSTGRWKAEMAEEMCIRDRSAGRPRSTSRSSLRRRWPWTKWSSSATER